MFHLSVQRRLRDLEQQLPAAFQAAVNAASDDGGPDQLTLLSIDLMRKSRSTLPFDALSPDEKRIAFYAYAVQELPVWMIPAATWRLRGADRALIGTLRKIRSSRPQRRETYFGAVRVQQQLRPTRKT
ncbi:hypothetical protein ACJ5NV_06235 [Loktanella agnita]|uniref:hypothetical protein n=1 Tax=Loktanella agnita TaxID=287097 RepID=UPI0039866F66